MFAGKDDAIKQSWLSVVDAQNIKEASAAITKKLWFSVLPGKERGFIFLYRNLCFFINSNMDLKTLHTLLLVDKVLANNFKLGLAVSRQMALASNRNKIHFYIF